jgi:hypothetical protein
MDLNHLYVARYHSVIKDVVVYQINVIRMISFWEGGIEAVIELFLKPGLQDWI